jgi:AcrR family transcriptional regulator
VVGMVIKKCKKGTMAKTTGSPKIPRLERGKARVAALKAAGTIVFTERGYDAATMTEIAARAPASIGSLYQFFPTKELLARAIHDELLLEMAAVFDELSVDASRSSAATIVDRLFESLITFIAQHPEFPTLSQRKEADPERKSSVRTTMREQISALLSRTTTPITAERAGHVAILVLELMKLVVSVGKTDGKAVRDAIFADVRRMLCHELGGRTFRSGAESPLCL